MLAPHPAPSDEHPQCSPLRSRSAPAQLWDKLHIYERPHSVTRRLAAYSSRLAARGGTRGADKGFLDYARNDPRELTAYGLPPTAHGWRLVGD